MVRELARRRGKSITAILRETLERELERERRRAKPSGVAASLMAIGQAYSALPTLDERSEDEILGYDEMTA